MKLKEIKDSFSLFVREFDRCDYSNLMEFLRFLVDEFDDDPNRIYEFIKTSSLNIDTKPLDQVNIKLVKNIKKAPVVRNILSIKNESLGRIDDLKPKRKSREIKQQFIHSDNESETYSEIETR
ncbi:unnamed protein product, partial [Brachionus calyciflorus]